MARGQFKSRCAHPGLQYPEIRFISADLRMHATLCGLFPQILMNSFSSSRSEISWCRFSSLYSFPSGGDGSWSRVPVIQTSAYPCVRCSSPWNSVSECCNVIWVLLFVLWYKTVSFDVSAQVGKSACLECWYSWVDLSTLLRDGYLMVCQVVQQHRGEREN